MGPMTTEHIWEAQNCWNSVQILLWERSEDDLEYSLLLFMLGSPESGTGLGDTKQTTVSI